LYDGFPVAMRPSPVPRHQVMAASLKGEFYLALKKCKACKVYDPLDYKIKEDIVLIPDMLVVCGKIKRNFLIFRLYSFQRFYHLRQLYVIKTRNLKSINHRE
jgi:hypothetical protein